MAANLSAEEAAHHRADVSDFDKLFCEEINLCRSFERIPAIVVVVADTTTFHLTDTALDRVSISGGASVYGVVQNFTLALRQHGVASCWTTLLCEFEPQIHQLLDIPGQYATALFVPVGYPEKGFPKKLRRLPVPELLFADTFGRSMVPTSA
jgi:nitroreductase